MLLISTIPIRLFGQISFNPFKQNGISHCYQMDWSISILRVVGWYFLFIF